MDFFDSGGPGGFWVGVVNTPHVIAAADGQYLFGQAGVFFFRKVFFPNDHRRRVKAADTRNLFLVRAGGESAIGYGDGDTVFRLPDVRGAHT